MAATPTKKPRMQEELEIADIDTCRDCVTVHGVVTELSPVKCSTRSEVKYFTGKLSDGKSTLRMVSFDPKLRPQLLPSYNKKVAVALTDCTVKPSQSGGSLEIQAATRRTAVQASPREFTLPADLRAIDPDAGVDVNIEDLEKLAVNQFITVCAKAVVVHGPESVDSKKTWRNLTKQECIVGDATGTIRIVLWQQDVGKLEEDHSYKISDAGLRVYRDVRYLSVSERCTITEIEEIGEVADFDESCDDAGAAKVIMGEIVAVLACEAYSSCPVCSSKMKLAGSSTIAECTKCYSKVKQSRCKRSKMAKVLFERCDSDEPERNKNYTLTIFDEVLSAILELEDAGDIERDLAERLLFAPALKCTVRNDIVYCAKPMD